MPRASVTAAFKTFTNAWEGDIPFAYLDIKGYVTIGLGFLADPVNAFVAMPLVNKRTLAPASTLDMVAEWHTVKSARMLIPLGWRAYERLTTLCLSEKSIGNLLIDKMLSNERILKARFVKFDSWPADAQLGLHSMAWSEGAGFWHIYPRFSSMCDALDFVGAAKECGISEVGNPGVRGRNIADELLFNNAAKVYADSQLDPEKLYYPQAAPAIALS
jgi:hypothetical protein